MTRVFLTELHLISYEILAFNYGCISNQKDIEISTTCYVRELINGMEYIFIIVVYVHFVNFLFWSPLKLN